jgi:hypothetical protein
MIKRRRSQRVNERFVPVRRAEVRSVDADGEAVLLDEANGRLHVLNATGSLVWACYDGHSSVREVVNDISDVLEVPRAIVLADTLEVTRRFSDEGLLANRGSAPPRRDAVNTAAFEAAAPSDPRFVPEPPNP